MTCEELILRQEIAVTKENIQRTRQETAGFRRATEELRQANKNSQRVIEARIEAHSGKFQSSE